MSFAELLCRTHYSFLRGASHPFELIDRAAELGLTAIAITDLDGVYGIPKAFVAAKKHSNLKLITGSTITLQDRPAITLLARDRAGYGLLCRIITASRANKPKGSAWLTWEEFADFARRPQSEGLIVIAEVASRVPEDHYRSLKEWFPERVYLPVSRFLDGRDKPRVERAVRLSRESGIALVATNDVHYHVPERRTLQDALVAIRENTPLDETGKKLFPNGERYLKSPEQMTELFKDLPEAVENSVKIAEACRFSPAELRYRYPSEWIPAGKTAQSYLEELTWKGAEWRYQGPVPEDARKQLKHELSLIQELQFADYFLTIWEIVQFAREKKIICQGRGSAANSAVCYVLGITAIDPVRMDLLFERFISVERGEPPDIDVDFEHERREEVIQHIYEKYGRDRAGMVAALITYRDKSIVRDLSKALGVSSDEARESPLSEEIKAFPRHLSIHSGGFTLSADPIIETVPIEPARMEGRTIVQWDKDDLAVIGLLKVDILALGMLSAIRKTFDLVRPLRELTLATIPAEDPATYAMIRKADTVGVFQIESRAQMSMLPRLLPKTFYDLVIEVAIVRPGPIVGQMVHPYLRRRRGLESSKSPDPRLEPILSRTLGVPLFQEQVMKMAMSMAGFSAGEADELRRAIGSWRSAGTIERLGRKLMAGLLASGLPQDFVDQVFLQIQGFAEYGFPESHAASFALIAYASSYLKCHYPAEFTAALINSQPMGFYSTHTLIEDAKRHGVVVLPLDPNVSDWDCMIETLEGGTRALRVGWRVVRSLGEDSARIILEERKRRKFESLADFVARTRLRLNVLYYLAMGEAFKVFGFDQRRALWEILASRNNGAMGETGFEGEQFELFAAVPSEPVAQQASFAGLTDYQAIQADYRSYGLSVRGHPMAALKKVLSRAVPTTTTQSVKRGPGNRGARLAGLVIVRQRPPTAKGTAFATLEDEAGFLDLILHKDIYEKYMDTFREEPFLIVSGNIQRDGELVNMIVRKVEKLDISGLGNLPVASRDFH